MAYCNNCGAYIPDGQTVCLACGSDMAKQPEQSVAAKAYEQKDTGNYYRFTNEELKRKLEEQRKKQQEENKKWADAEKRRRDAQREFRQHEYEYPPKASKRSGESRGKIFSILSYLSFLFVIPMVFTPEDKDAMFHAKQGLRLFIYGLICDALSKIPILGPMIGLTRIYFVIKGMINAGNGNNEPLPYIGKIGSDRL